MKNLFENDYVIFAIISTLIILLFAGVVYFGEKNTCEKKAKLMNIESNYAPSTGCMVKINGNWQPFNDYITINK